LLKYPKPLVKLDIYFKSLLAIEFDNFLTIYLI